MPTFSRVRRKRGPALNWAPAEDSYYELAQFLRSGARTPLYITQAAILECEGHLRETASPLPFGLLAGDICICPETQLEYLLVDTVRRARIELADDDPCAQLTIELQSLTAEQANRSKLAIGWYLGGMADDLTLDDDVTSVHRELFPGRWQVALVRGGDAGVERGAFLRYEDLWSRWYSIPFFEILAEGAGHKNEEKLTAIRWANYRSDTPARPLGEFEALVRKANAGTPSWWGSGGFSASLEPIRRAVRGIAVRAQSTSAPVRQEVLSALRETAVSPATAPRPVVPPSHSQPLEATPSPRRAPDPSRGEPAERNGAIRVEQTVAAPLERRPTAPAEPRDTAAVDHKLAVSVEHEVTTPSDRTVAPTPEEKVASAAEVRVAARPEVKLAAPVGPPGNANGAREEPQFEVQHIFINGSLVPIPVDYVLPEKPSMLLGSQGVRISSLVVGALLLMLLLLYLIAS